MGHRWARRTDNAGAVRPRSDHAEAYTCILNAVSKPSVVRAKQEVEMEPGIGDMEKTVLGAPAETHIEKPSPKLPHKGGQT